MLEILENTVVSHVATEPAKASQPGTHILLQPLVSTSDQPNVSAKQKVTASLSEVSTFLSVAVVAEPICNDGSIVSIFDRSVMSSVMKLSQPSRQGTLDRALELQTQVPEIYQDLSHKIIQMVIKSVNCADKSVRPLGRDSELTTSVAKIINDFVVKNSVKQKFDFMSASSNSCAKTSVAQRFTPEFYSSILPLDLAKIASEQIRQKNGRSLIHHCIGHTKSSKMLDRCKNKSKYSKATLDGLLGELSCMAKPRKFAEAIRILVSLAKLVYCSKYHLAKPECDLRMICERFMQGGMSDDWKDELKGFELWLTQLEPTVKGETSFTSLQDMPLKNALFLTASDPRESVPVNALVQTDQSMFIFGEQYDLVALGFEDTSQSTVSNGPHTLQRYYKDKKQWNLPASQIETNIRKCAEKDITKADLEATGTIYIFRHSEGIGFHKIGYSSHVGDRLKQWAELCKYAVDERADRLDHQIERRAPHPSRLEKLIFTELSTKRYKIVDCNCKARHQEWFEIDANYAQKIVAKWTLWMQKKPYDEAGKFKEHVELPELGVEAFRHLDDSERRQSEVMQEQANARQKLRRYSEHVSEFEAQPASAHGMMLRSQAKSRKRPSA